MYLLWLLWCLKPVLLLRLFFMLLLLWFLLLLLRAVSLVTLRRLERLAAVATPSTTSKGRARPAPLTPLRDDISSMRLGHCLCWRAAAAATRKQGALPSRRWDPAQETTTSDLPSLTSPSLGAPVSRVRTSVHRTKVQPPPIGSGCTAPDPPPP